MNKEEILKFLEKLYAHRRGTLTDEELHDTDLEWELGHIDHVQGYIDDDWEKIEQAKFYDVFYGWKTTVEASTPEEAREIGAKLFHEDWKNENVDIPLENIENAIRVWGK